MLGERFDLSGGLRRRAAAFVTVAALGLGVAIEVAQHPAEAARVFSDIGRVATGSIVNQPVFDPTAGHGHGS